MDAWDDRESDAKRGGYNPFLLSQMTCERAAFLLNITKNEAEKGYDLLSLSAPNGLLDNIMRLGLTHTQKRVLAGQEGCDAQTAPQKDKGDKE